MNANLPPAATFHPVTILAEPVLCEEKRASAFRTPMATRKLSNYLKTYRKQSDLTQDEVAYLLGLSEDSKVSGYENHRVIPSFPVLLAYAVIFKAPLQDLFAGRYEEITKLTRRRARRLLARLGSKPANPRLARKLQLLEELAQDMPPHIESPKTL